MKQAIRYLRSQLAGTYPDTEAQAIAYLLLEKRYGLTRLDVCLGKDRTFSPDERQEWADIVRRLQACEPVQHLLGEADFDGHTFEVSRHTLIPRPETGELVTWIAEDCTAAQGTQAPSPLKVLDIGTGSGCIAISLSLRLPHARIEGWDISEEALATARRNNERLGTNVTLARHDILHTGPVPAAYDIIVSNPPYITESEKRGMHPNVLRWEPAGALFVSDDDPLLFYRAIARFAHTSLRPGGRLYLEINRAFGPATAALLNEVGFGRVELRKDYVGNDRMIKACL